MKWMSGLLSHLAMYVCVCGGGGVHCKGLLALALASVRMVSLLSLHEFALSFSRVSG